MIIVFQVLFVNKNH